MEIFYYLIYFLISLLSYPLAKHFLIRKPNTQILPLPPSPAFPLPIIGHLHLLQAPLHRALAKLSDKYGAVSLLHFGSRRVLHVSSPALAEECFTKNDVAFANRPGLLAGKHLGYNYTSLVWAPYGQHWRNLRRVATIEMLSSARIHMLHQIRVDETRALLRRLFEKSTTAGGVAVVGMRSVFFELILNVMMKMIAGKRYYKGDGAGAGGEEELEEAKRFKEIVEETMELSGATNVGDFVPVLRWVGLSNVEKRLAVLQRKRDGFMQKLIEERRRSVTAAPGASKERDKTMTDVLLGLQEAEPNYYTDDIIRGLMQVMLSAGTDTSVATMEWALSLLLNNPETIVKVKSEIDTIIGHTTFLEESDLPKLPYLSGIIKETLRMHPAAPLLVPHESSEECTVGGFRVPRGTMLLVNVWAIHNDPRVWEDPDKFKPERFLNDGEGENKGGQFLWVPFGAGRRRCPGESLAMRVVGLALGSVLQCFEWERPGEEMVDMTEANGLTTPKVHPLWVTCRPSLDMVHLLSQL